MPQLGARARLDVSGPEAEDDPGAGDARRGVLGQHVLFDQCRTGPAGGDDGLGQLLHLVDPPRGQGQPHAFCGQSF